MFALKKTLRFVKLIIWRMPTKLFSFDNTLQKTMRKIATFSLLLNESKRCKGIKKRNLHCETTKNASKFKLYFRHFLCFSFSLPFSRLFIYPFFSLSLSLNCSHRKKQRRSSRGIPNNRKLHTDFVGRHAMDLTKNSCDLSEWMNKPKRIRSYHKRTFASLRNESFFHCAKKNNILFAAFEWSVLLN